MMISIYVYQDHPQDAKRAFCFVRDTGYSPMLAHERVINHKHSNSSIRTHKNSRKHR